MKWLPRGIGWSAEDYFNMDVSDVLEEASSAIAACIERQEPRHLGSSKEPEGTAILDEDALIAGDSSTPMTSSLCESTPELAVGLGHRG